MTEEEAINLLKREGFVNNITAFSFGPNEINDPHSHETTSLRIVAKGQVLVTDEDGTRSYEEGEKIYCPPGSKHISHCGPAGCKFVIGEK